MQFLNLQIVKNHQFVAWSTKTNPSVDMVLGTMKLVKLFLESNTLGKRFVSSSNRRHILACFVYRHNDHLNSICLYKNPSTKDLKMKWVVKNKDIKWFSWWLYKFGIWYGVLFLFSFMNHILDIITCSNANKLSNLPKIA